MLNTGNRASADYPIHDLLAERWSPDSFDSKPVSASDLRSLFEAARWAPSSYNEQPWRYIVATKDNLDDFNRLLSCLDEGNQKWAKTAPVLALAVVNRKFSRNGKDNRAATHDLGLATANLAFEATSRNLVVHQMIGIIPEKARDLYAIPEDSEAWTALAIGYSGAEELNVKTNNRKRKKLNEFVYGGVWGEPASFISNE